MARSEQEIATFYFASITKRSWRKRVLSTLKAIVKDNADEAASFVAQQITSFLKARPDFVMDLATGETMRPIYAGLNKNFQTSEAPSAAFSSFNLDKFI